MAAIFVGPPIRWLHVRRRELALWSGQTNKWMNVAGGQPKNIVRSLTLSCGDSIIKPRKNKLERQLVVKVMDN